MLRSIHDALFNENGMKENDRVAILNSFTLDIHKQYKQNSNEIILNTDHIIELNGIINEFIAKQGQKHNDQVLRAFFIMISEVVDVSCLPSIISLFSVYWKSFDPYSFGRSNLLYSLSKLLEFILKTTRNEPKYRHLLESVESLKTAIFSSLIPPQDLSLVESTYFLNLFRFAEITILTSESETMSAALFDKLVSFCLTDKILNPTLFSALISIFGSISSQISSFIPKVISLLLEIHESPPIFLSSKNIAVDNFRKNSLSHQIKILLSISYKTKPQDCTEFDDMIKEALIELHSGKQQSKLSKAIKQRASAPEIEQKPVQKKAKHEKTNDSPLSEIDAKSFPLQVAVDVIFSTLLRVTFEELEYLTSKWNPLLDLGTQQSTQRKDPRASTRNQPIEVATTERKDPRRAPPATQTTTASTTTTGGFELKPLTPGVNQDKCNALINEAFDRILSAEKTVMNYGARDEWARLLTKLSLVITSPETISVKSDEMIKSEDQLLPIALKEKLLSWILADIKNKLDFALLWLHHEWLTDAFIKKTNRNNELQYKKWFSIFLDALTKDLDSNDRTFTKYLLSSPSLPMNDIVSPLLEQMTFTNNEKLGLGLATLKDLIMSRNSVRSDCLMILAKCALSNDEIVKNTTIALIRKWLLENAPKTVKSFIENISLQHIEDKPDLFFSVCSFELSFISHLYKKIQNSHFYERVEIKEHLSNLFKEARISGADLSNLVALIKEYPTNELSLYILKNIADTQNADNLNFIVKSILAFFRDELISDVRYILPILHGMSKSELSPFLRDVLNFINLSTTESTAASNEIILRLVSNKQQQQSAVYSPSEFFTLVHSMEADLGLKKIVDITTVCFSLVNVYKPDVLISSLQVLVEAATLSTLLMRSIIQSVTLYRSIGNFVLTLLSRLVSKKIWNNSKLWEGFIRCCQLLVPSSFSILITLPNAQLNDFLSKSSPNIKSELIEYVKHQAPSLRNRLSEVFQVFNK